MSTYIDTWIKEIHMNIIKSNNVQVFAAVVVLVGLVLWMVGLQSDSKDNERCAQINSQVLDAFGSGPLQSDVNWWSLNCAGAKSNG